MANKSPDSFRFRSVRSRAEEFAATARRLDAERAAGSAVVDEALRTTPQERWGTLAEHPAFLTSGVLGRIAEIVDRELNRQPKYAEAIAVLGASIADAIAPDAYPSVIVAQMRASAWKDYGKVLSYLARHDEALTIFDRAESYVDELTYGVLAYDRAVIDLNRAITVSEMGRHDTALALLAQCKPVFRHHGDRNLHILCGYYEGVALQRLERHREARETYLLLVAMEDSIEKRTLAAIHQTIGLCSIELRDFEAAEDSLTKAIGLHTELGQPLDAAKGEYARGRLLLRKGLARRAIEHLRPVRHRFLVHSLAEEAGLCGLEIVEGMLQIGMADEAERLARTIMAEFMAARLNGRAISALGYLTEAITAKKAQPRLVTQVREYVLSLRTAPEREFQPL